MAKYHVDWNASEEQRTLDSQRHSVGEINRALKRAGIYATKKEYGLGFWCVQNGVNDGWVVEPTVGNSRITLWHSVGNGWGDPRQGEVSPGPFGVAVRDTSGSPLTDNNAASLPHIIDGLRGTRDEKVKLLMDIARTLHQQENDCDEKVAAASVRRE
jgi:hypothetical protein